jgi:predicted TIM-barrel fold metal-dependent hydrolase
MKHTKTSLTLTLWIFLLLLTSCHKKPSYYCAVDFEKVQKIDAHFHYLATDGRYLEFASSLNFGLLSPNLVWERTIDEQLKISESFLQAFPGKYAFFGTFSVDSFNYPDFAAKTITIIKECIKAGATGIKIWKNIGMVLKDPDGRYVMIDDPAFEPVFKYLEENKIPVIGHLGEPKDCWLPYESMTDPSDLNYYKKNLQYYMYLHPEVPSYDEQINARDNILKKYSDLDFIGAHLASLEWSVDELAKRLDSYPNLKVDLAARMNHLQNQSNIDWEKVRNFMIKYQDRILYATDYEVHDVPGSDYMTTIENLRKGWIAQWIYLATDSLVEVKGLHLPAEVIDKIYYKNAIRYFK